MDKLHGGENKVLSRRNKQKGIPDVKARERKDEDGEKVKPVNQPHREFPDINPLHHDLLLQGPYLDQLIPVRVNDMDGAGHTRVEGMDGPENFQRPVGVAERRIQ
jgi:hypothetical protein